MASDSQSVAVARGQFFQSYYFKAVDFIHDGFGFVESACLEYFRVGLVEENFITLFQGVVSQGVCKILDNNRFVKLVAIQLHLKTESYGQAAFQGGKHFVCEGGIYDSEQDEVGLGCRGNKFLERLFILALTGQAVTCRQEGEDKTEKEREDLFIHY